MTLNVVLPGLIKAFVTLFLPSDFSHQMFLSATQQVQLLVVTYCDINEHPLFSPGVCPHPCFRAVIKV